MDIKYNKEDFISLIEKYYLEREGRSVEVTVDVQKDYPGIYALPVCATTIKLTEDVELLGKKAILNDELNREDVKNIFDQLLEGSDYKLIDFEYEDGLRNETEACLEGLPLAYFNGIKLTVDRVKTLVKKG